MKRCRRNHHYERVPVFLESGCHLVDPRILVADELSAHMLWDLIWERATYLITRLFRRILRLRKESWRFDTRSSLSFADGRLG